MPRSKLKQSTVTVDSPGLETARLSGSPFMSAVGSQVVNQIGREIITGIFAPNTKLPDEATMRARYSVSRTALREAYSKLSAKGLIWARPKVGTAVRPRSSWNMLDPEVLTWHLQTMPIAAIVSDLYALRRMVEPGACALAAETHNEEDLAEMRGAFADMVANANTTERELIRADLRFHLAILKATKNHFIGAFSSLIHAAMYSAFEISWRGASFIKSDRLDQHRAVLDAIADRDSARASRCMEDLLDDSVNDVHIAMKVES